MCNFRFVSLQNHRPCLSILVGCFEGTPCQWTVLECMYNAMTPLHMHGPTPHGQVMTDQGIKLCGDCTHLKL